MSNDYEHGKKKHTEKAQIPFSEAGEFWVKHLDSKVAVLRYINE